MIMKKVLLLVLLLGVFLTGCAEAPANDPAGFFMGLWHGIIAPISFIISLFNDNVIVYACNNVGGWYDFGFLLGIGAFASGTSR